MEYFKNCMTKEQLEQEHKRLVIQLHPDRNPNNPNATAEFQEMQAQYEERLAELNGDYTKARKGRERREREERERQEREKKERERRKVEQVIEQARLNKQKSHRELKAGDYIYVQQVKVNDTDHLHMYYLLRQLIENGIADECVVKIEKIFETNNDNFFGHVLNDWLSESDIYGGWEVLQTADLASGVKKSKRVAKVVMVRATDYCMFGNPMGDHQFSTFYLRPDYDTMFGSRIKDIRGRVEYERQEKARIEAERKAKLLAEQQPIINEWEPKLICLSRGLSSKEQKAVAIDNFRTMLKTKFGGTKFTVREDRYGDVYVRWEDGPKLQDVCKVMDLFDAWKLREGKEPTPWMEHYGKLSFSLGEVERKMSTLTKARILQQLGQVTDTFCKSGYDDEVTVTDFDWMMLHLLVGIDINAAGHDAECFSTLHADGRRSVAVRAAVSYIFIHSDYSKAKKTKTKTRKAA